MKIGTTSALAGFCLSLPAIYFLELQSVGAIALLILICIVVVAIPLSLMNRKQDPQGGESNG